MIGLGILCTSGCGSTEESTKEMLLWTVAFAFTRIIHGASVAKFQVVAGTVTFTP